MTAPDPFDPPAGWNGGLCCQHGTYYVPDCRWCPPAGHPLQRWAAERRERRLAPLRQAS